MNRYTQMQIADMVGTTQATVSRVIKRTIENFTNISVENYHAKQAAMFADLHAVVLPRVLKGEIKAIDALVKLDDQMAKHIPGGVMPTKHEVAISADEQAQAALALLQKIKEREVIDVESTEVKEIEA